MPKPAISLLAPIPEYDGNPFIDRLPPVRSLKQIQDSLRRDPLHSQFDRERSPEERLHAVLRLLHYSQPTINARELGLLIDQMIRQSYIGRDPRTTQWMRFVHACASREDGEREKHKRRERSKLPTADSVLGSLSPVRDTSMSSLVIGPPGMGKTHAGKTTLLQYDQVIFHKEPVQVAQIVWLRVECPPDGSLVSLCRFFFAAVDKALHEAGFESNLAGQYKASPLAILLTGMARVANLHAIGLLVVDEIQHVKVSRSEGSALLNFLVTLRNTIGISLLMIGTMSALPVMQRTFRDARRGDGIGSIPFNRMAPFQPAAEDSQDEVGNPADGAAECGSEEVILPIYGEEFESFVRRMWRWQYTKDWTEPSVSVLNALYHETQGIIDLVVKLFILCQMRLITVTAARPDNVEIITPELIHEVADRSFNTVRPFVKALRENDVEKLKTYEDLIDFGSWFASQAGGFGIPEAAPLNDADHGAPMLPPMIVEGSIDRNVLDQLLEGFKVAVADRASMLSRHSKLIEAGNIAGLMEAVQVDLRALDAHGRLVSGDEKKKKTPPIEGDIRSALDGVHDKAAVAAALGAPTLDSALDE